jgi:dihydrodipicolinate synthase/N-acetylneuraminate lyase
VFLYTGPDRRPTMTMPPLAGRGVIGALSSAAVRRAVRMVRAIADEQSEAHDAEVRRLAREHERARISAVLVQQPQVETDFPGAVG